MNERDFELDFIVEGEDGEPDSHYKVAGTVYEGREFRAVSNWSYRTPPEPQNYRSYTPAPSKDQSFEDKLKQFMSESDSKLSSVRQYSEHRTKTRRR